MKVRESIDEVESVLIQIMINAKDGDFDSIESEAKDALDSVAKIRDAIDEVEIKSIEIKSLSSDISKITY